ncbi:MAG: non-ribosomal peptide synthetase, partial [Candidatus Aminicenantes bacterium]|nr:non-ribosomal peptide synthetase [Candidatus Aminicenantes bacterium]
NRILSSILENPLQKLWEIEIISPEEKKKILFDFNNTGVEYPTDKTIPQLFEEQVERAHDRIAVFSHGRTRTNTDNNVSLSYRLLNEQSGRLAGLLIEKGVLADDIVSIMMERSIDLIIGILGILKAGAAYLPIDPEYPQERIDYMLKDSGTKIMIRRAEERKSGSAEFVFSCFFLASSLPRFLASNFLNLAYVMYTSGSTGKPRGVVVTHRNVVRLVKNTNFVPLTGETRILQTGAPVFDATTFEIWGSLLNGGQLALVGKEVILDTRRLGDALMDFRINTLWLSAPLFNQLLQQNIELFASLSYLLVGGDVLSPGHINRVRGQFPYLRIINGYGPTENTTFSTTYLIEKEFEQGIPIGRPIANSTAYIYDRNNRLSPIGVCGELYVGGDGVSLGYLNSPELTAEKFINKSFGKSRNPYSKRFLVAGGPLYRTGDLARWLPDPTAQGAYIIEFLGRIDQQFKIRGFRIELAEIENRLLDHESVKEAIVMTRLNTAGARYLCAYIVPAGDLSTSEVREYLSAGLPDYMVPSFFVLLEKIPLTPNGKLDTKALPIPSDSDLQRETDYVPPRTRMEQLIAGIWREVLGVEIIGVHDKFFNVGGNSLDVIRVNDNLNRFLQENIPVVDMFRYTTIADLARYLTREETEEGITPGFTDRDEEVKKGKARRLRKIKKGRSWDQ